MRVLRLLLIATLTCGSLLLLAPGAGAASKNCKTLTSLNNKLSSIDTSGSNFKASAYEDVGDEFQSAAKKAKGKLKSALNDLGEVYDTIGSGDVTDLAAIGSTKYSNSLKTFIKATVNCA